MQVTRSGSTDRRYRGKPAAFEMGLGWHRHGKIVYEWALPLKGPSTYEDHLNAHDDGETGKSGSGRFAYIDTDSIGGVLIELRWNYRAPAGKN